VRRFLVDPPATVEPGPAALGRLGPPVRWLAAAQGAWPPHPPQLVHRNPDEPPADPDEGPAQLTAAALEAGAVAADSAADAGAGLLLAESASSAGPALAAVASLLHLEPVVVVGTAGGEGWAALLGQVRDGLLRRDGGTWPNPAGILLAPRAVPALARLVGLLALGPPVRRTPVVPRQLLDRWRPAGTGGPSGSPAPGRAPGGWRATPRPTPGGRRALADLDSRRARLRLATGGASRGAVLPVAGGSWRGG
jgi:hypothetical protein